MAGLSTVGGYFCVEVGFGLEGKGTLAVNPRRAVTLETNSAERMVLYPIDNPDTRAIKGTVVEKKRLKDKSVNLTGDAVAAGYLLFPADNNASRVTVIVVVATRRFVFPSTGTPMPVRSLELPISVMIPHLDSKRRLQRQKRNRHP